MRIATVMATASAVLMLGLQGTGRAEEKFERLAVYLEQNVQDEDVEVKFEAIGPSVGLTALKVAGPDGRTVIDFSTPGSRLGIQHLVLESPEPKNNGSIEADFPQGVYRFTGTTAKGASLQGEARLSHKLPEPVSLLRPHAEERNVPVTGLQVRWNPRRKVNGYVVVVEDEKSGREMSASLLASARGFTIPDGFLAPGTEYKLGIAAVAADGNRAFIETAFTTSARR
jgi:predicted RNA-binding protein with TRAM domain